MTMSPFAFGTLITALGVLILSPDAALILLVDMDPYGLVFWRGCASFVVLSIATTLVCRQATFVQFKSALLGAGSLIAFLISLGNIGFVLGAERGDPAFTVIAVAASPLFATLFSWVLFGERADRITLVAIAFGFLGVGLGAFEVLGRNDAYLEGLLGAALVPVILGLSFTLTRYLPRHQNIWAIYTLAGLYTMVMALFLQGDLRVQQETMGYFLLLVGVVVPFAFLLISMGPRYISAAQTSLMLLLETALSPIWVYVAVQLVPGPLTLFGGVILVLMLFGQTLAQLMRGTVKRERF